LTAGWEFDQLMTHTTVAIGVVAIAFLGASLGGAALYFYRNAPPTCDSERALDRISEVLRDDFHLDSILVNNVSTVSGGFFGDNQDCSAEVAEIRGGVDASDMRWREIRYRIVQLGSQPFTITVELGDHVPLDPQTPSLWARVLAYL
jgi:hypothetical protein